jgi:hypothetical protein
VDDLDEGLSRGQALGHLGAEGARAGPLDEILDHGQRHVGLEQGHAHLSQRVADVVFRDTATPLQGIAGARQAVGQILEHCFPEGSVASRRPNYTRRPHGFGFPRF